MVVARSLYVGDLPDGRVVEPWEVIVGHVVLFPVNVQPQPVAVDVGDLNFLSENRWAHADSITYTSIRPEVVDLCFGEDAVEVPEAAHDEVAEDEADGDGDGGLVGFGAAVFEQ